MSQKTSYTDYYVKIAFRGGGVISLVHAAEEVDNIKTAIFESARISSKDGDVFVISTDCVDFVQIIPLRKHMERAKKVAQRRQEMREVTREEASQSDLFMLDDKMMAPIK